MMSTASPWAKGKPTDVVGVSANAVVAVEVARAAPPSSASPKNRLNECMQEAERGLRVYRDERSRPQRFQSHLKFAPAQRSSRPPGLTSPRGDSPLPEGTHLSQSGHASQRGLPSQRGLTSRRGDFPPAWTDYLPEGTSLLPGGTTSRRGLTSP